MHCRCIIRRNGCLRRLSNSFTRSQIECNSIIVGLLGLCLHVKLFVLHSFQKHVKSLGLSRGTASCCMLSLLAGVVQMEGFHSLWHSSHMTHFHLERFAALSLAATAPVVVLSLCEIPQWIAFMHFDALHVHTTAMHGYAFM